MKVVVKTLIWIGCLVLYGIINAVFLSSGERLGAIPAVLLIAFVGGLGKLLCSKYDERIHIKELRREMNEDEKNKIEES